MHLYFFSLETFIFFYAEVSTSHPATLHEYTMHNPQRFGSLLRNNCSYNYNYVEHSLGTLVGSLGTLNSFIRFEFVKGKLLTFFTSLYRTSCLTKGSNFRNSSFSASLSRTKFTLCPETKLSQETRINLLLTFLQRILVKNIS